MDDIDILRRRLASDTRISENEMELDRLRESSKAREAARKSATIDTPSIAPVDEMAERQARIQKNLARAQKHMDSIKASSPKTQALKSITKKVGKKVGGKLLSAVPFVGPAIAAYGAANPGDAMASMVGVDPLSTDPSEAPAAIRARGNELKAIDQARREEGLSEEDIVRRRERDTILQQMRDRGDEDSIASIDKIMEDRMKKREAMLPQEEAYVEEGEPIDTDLSNEELAKMDILRGLAERGSY